MGLIGWIDPAVSAPRARPIWSGDTDPAVLDSRPAAAPAEPTVPAADSLDILTVALLVTVEVTAEADTGC